MSNHSGGLLAMDVPVFATGFYEKFGYERPVYTLSHDMLMTGPTAAFFKKTGLSGQPRERRTRRAALGRPWWRSPAVTTTCTGLPSVPTRRLRRADRAMKAAINAGVPIVPMVGIGGQEAQLFLSCGTGVAKALGPIARLGPHQDRARVVRFPVRLSAVLPLNATADQDRDGDAADRHRCGVR